MGLKTKILNMFFSSEIEEIRDEYKYMFNEYQNKVDSVLNSEKTAIRDLEATLKSMESKLTDTEKKLRAVTADLNSTKTELNVSNSALKLESHNNSNLKIVLSTTEEENCKFRQIIDKQKEAIEALTVEVSNMAISTADVEAKDKTSSLPNEDVTKMFYERMQQELASLNNKEKNNTQTLETVCDEDDDMSDDMSDDEIMLEEEEEECESIDSIRQSKFISKAMSNIAMQVSNSIKVNKRNNVVSDLRNFSI